MIGDEFLRHFRLCDEEDSGLSDERMTGYRSIHALNAAAFSRLTTISTSG